MWKRAMRPTRWGVVAVLVAAVAVAGCATTPKTEIGKAVAAADIQKKVVERAAIEFIKLHLTCVPASCLVDDATYAKGRAAYAKWAAGQTAIAETLATWKRVGDAASGAKLATLLKQADTLAIAYLEVVRPFVNVDAITKATTR